MSQRSLRASALPLLLPCLAVGVEGCWLERVTGEEVPLDPAYYAAVEATQGEPGVGGGSAVPFGLYQGERVTLRGEVTGGEAGLSVDIDVRVPDPKAEGGVDAKGKLLLEGPGAFELTVPIDLGPLELQAFQDLAGDGPTADDAFAQVELVVESVDLDGVSFSLEVGALPGGGGPVHSEAPVGAPGGAAVPGQAPNSGAQPPPGDPNEPPPPGDPSTPPPGGAGGGDPFAGLPGPRVTVKGALVWPEGGTIDLDLFRPDDRSSGGRQPVGKLKLPPGPFSIEVPVGFGALVLEAFIDRDANGPGPGDPRGCYAEGVLEIGDEDLSGVTILLTVADDGKADSCGSAGTVPSPRAPPPRR